VQVTDGLFNVVLGGTTALDEANFHQPLYLEVEVGGETLLPRQKLLAAAYAFSLVPGAVIKGYIAATETYSSTLNVANLLAADGGQAIGARSFSGTAIAGLGGSRGVYGYSGGGDGVHGEAIASNKSGVYGHSTDGFGVTGRSTNNHAVQGFSTSHNHAAVYGNSTEGIGVLGEHTDPTLTSPGVYGKNTGSGSGVLGDADSGAGVIARSKTGNPLEAYDTSPSNRRFYVSNAGNVYADGTFNPGGADLAEMLPAMEGLQPGDVLVIGPDGKLARSIAPYASNVVGVYSTNPGFVGGSDEDGTNPGKVPLAVIGVVPVKASAENGPIAPGDLLTTSSTPGYAMRADHFVGGAILGKALEGLDESTGVILMLVMLQ